MGCIPSKKKAKSKTVIKAKLPQESPEKAAPKKISELTSSEEVYDRIRQVGSFKLEITGLLPLHNHMCRAREKKDAHSLVVLDVSELAQFEDS